MDTSKYDWGFGTIRDSKGDLHWQWAGSDSVFDGFNAARSTKITAFWFRGRLWLRAAGGKWYDDPYAKLS